MSQVETTVTVGVAVTDMPAVVELPANTQSDLTYEQLLTEHLGTVDDKYQRSTRYALKAWLSFLGLNWKSAVGAEMDRKFDATINRFAEAFAKRVSDRSSSNVVSALRAVRKTAQVARFRNGPPADLAGAIQYGLQRLGKPLIWLGSRKDRDTRNIAEWARGISTPRQTEPNREALHSVEDLLEMPRGTLVERAWPSAPNQIMTLSDDIPYRRYQSVALAAKYGLPYQNWPEHLTTAWEQFVAHKRKTEHLLVSGLVHLNALETWNSDATVKLRRDSSRRYFGFLIAPAMPAGHESLPWDQAIRYGHGLTVDQLRFTMLVQQEYLYPYMKFCELRTFDEAHYLDHEATVDARKTGMPAPKAKQAKKTLPASFLVFLELCGSLVSKPTSFLRLHPEFGGELDPPIPTDQWEAWCKTCHMQILALKKAARSKVERHKRSNRIVLASVLREEDPRSVYIKIVDAMRAESPPRTAPWWRALRLRDIAIMSLLNFISLRAKNLSDLNIGKHLTERDGKLRLFVPKEEMKNNIWGHAEDIDRVLPDDVAADMRAWLEARSVVTGHDKTKAVFIAGESGRRGKDRADKYRMTPNGISLRVAVHTKKYLGVSVRAHSVRNINATSIVRLGGTVAQVKAILNDSAKTAYEIYADIKNCDESRALDELYERSREKAVRS